MCTWVSFVQQNASTFANEYNNKSEAPPPQNQPIKVKNDLLIPAWKWQFHAQWISPTPTTLVSVHLNFLHLSVILLQEAVAQKLDEGLIEGMEELLEMLDEREGN